MGSRGCALYRLGRDCLPAGSERRTIGTGAETSAIVETGAETTSAGGASGTTFIEDGKRAGNHEEAEGRTATAAPAPAPAAEGRGRVFAGAQNDMTIKECQFMGKQESFVACGSDDGTVYIWDKRTGRIQLLVHADSHVANVVQGHPQGLPVFATSGIDRHVRIWQPTSWDEDGGGGGRPPTATMIRLGRLHRFRSVRIRRLRRMTSTTFLTLTRWSLNTSHTNHPNDNDNDNNKCVCVCVYVILPFS